jgi:hypothetical protein
MYKYKKKRGKSMYQDKLLNNNNQNDNLFVMDRNNIPKELLSIGVELIKLDSQAAAKGIPFEDIEKITAAIKNLKKFQI